MDFGKYDMEYLVSQYEMMLQVYEHPESVGRERIEKMRVAYDSFDKDVHKSTIIGNPSS